MFTTGTNRGQMATLIADHFSSDEQICETNNGIERGTDFMSHNCQKLILSAVSSLRFLAFCFEYFGIFISSKTSTSQR